MAVEKFEELVAWQKARSLTKAIYAMTNSPAFSRDWRLANQMRASAVSVLANIAEGFERNALREFSRFLSIAKASCAELRAELYVAVDARLIPMADFERTLAQAEEVGKIIGGLRQSLLRRLRASRSPA